MDNNKTEVCVHEGKLIGTIEKGVYGDYYMSFRGIPYAKPPIGDLRFKDPVPVEPWSGDRDATKHGNIAIQMNFFTNKVEGDEDCLYLNVYTTKIDPSEKHSVMVWIHGGGYFAGSGDTASYGPDYIMQKDIVLVTLNYRLDVLGFLNLNDKVAAGNQGLKDVVLALKWVKRNISKFGGDPENVTIFGESAGGGIVHCLALSPTTKGLFHKIIAQSGVATNPWALTESTNEVMNRGFQLAEKLGKTTSDPKVAYEFLKSINAKKLIEYSQMLYTSETMRLSFNLCFTPSWDHKSLDPLFPEHPKEYISRGIQMPFLLGITRNEGVFILRSVFFGDISKERLEQVNADFKKAILPQVLSKLPEIGITVEELRSLYFGKKKVSEETLTNYSYFLGDEFFVRGTMDVVQIQKSTGSYKSTYLYQFDYDSDTSFVKTILNVGLPGVCHSEDLGFLFCPEMRTKFNLSPPKPGSEDYKMINHLIQMWTDFAKTGNPTPTTNLWLPLTCPEDENYNYLSIDKKSQMKIFRKGKERWDWENYNKN
ncbi:esterase FE4 [Monomorium pharaonis]|uniref:esterase FE4 n=1 Tax=Monomorium pharaonis TaxID=307658 RepID=UPI00063FCBD2|nr:esterase FE4 [Monomorium pharaonis]